MQPWLYANTKSSTTNDTEAKFHSIRLTPVHSFQPLFWYEFAFAFFRMWEELFPKTPLSSAQLFATHTPTTYQGNKAQFCTFEFKSPKVDIGKDEHCEKLREEK